MDLADIPLLAMLRSRLNYLSQRQEVIAQNVANADTPGYLAKDVKAPSFRELIAGSASRLPLAATQPMHLAGTRLGPELRAEPVKRTPRTLTGNSVDIEQEMMKIAETASDHHLVTSLYKRNLNLLRTAIGRSGG